MSCTHDEEDSNLIGEKVYKPRGRGESTIQFAKLANCTSNTMMKYVILAALVAVAFARPQGDKDASLVSSNNDNQGDGKYQWDFKTSDGTEAGANGDLKKNPNPLNEPERGYDEIQAVQGNFNYAADQNTKVVVTYTADEKGYRAKTVIS